MLTGESVLERKFPLFLPFPFSFHIFLYCLSLYYLLVFLFENQVQEFRCLWAYVTPDLREGQGYAPNASQPSCWRARQAQPGIPRRPWQEDRPGVTLKKEGDLVNVKAWCLPGE